jgi:hypothetical protein
MGRDAAVGGREADDLACAIAWFHASAQRWLADGAGPALSKLGESVAHPHVCDETSCRRSTGESRDDRDTRIGRQGSDGVGGRRGFRAAVRAADRNPDWLGALLDREQDLTAQREILRGLDGGR